MAGPFRCTSLVLKVTASDIGDAGEVILDVVEGLDIDLGYEGGPEAIYGSRTKKHSAGSRRVTFTITRWYFTHSGEEDLLLDLFNNEKEFTLEGSLEDKDGEPVSESTIKITGCKLYRWRPRTGGADDIIGEEGSGSGTGWVLTGFKNSP